jgi:predicted O-methyltransferase YrrM
VSEEEKALEVFYRRYVGSVSPAHMTASWEVCLFLHRLVRLESLRRVSDIGSGFSSFILRSAVAGLSPPGFVHSVENDPEWKERTAQFLDSDASGRGALMGIERFLADPQAVDLDLIFHDLGGLDKRVSLFPVVLSRLRPGGVLVADDVHKPQVRSGLLRALRPGDEVVDLFANTHDAFGRHSLAVRVRSSVRAR